MDNIKDLLLQACIGLIAFLGGMRYIEKSLESVIHSKVGTIFTQVLTYSLILASYIIFTTKELEKYSLIGTIFSALAITIVTTLFKEKNSNTQNYFDSDLLSIIKLPPDSYGLNNKAIRRLFLSLESSPQCQTSCRLQEC